MPVQCLGELVGALRCWVHQSPGTEVLPTRDIMLMEGGCSVACLEWQGKMLNWLMLVVAQGGPDPAAAEGQDRAEPALLPGQGAGDLQDCGGHQLRRHGAHCVPASLLCCYQALYSELILAFQVHGRAPCTCKCILERKCK